MPAKPLPPVTITAFGNRLVAVSDDPEVLELIAQLVRMLVNTEARGCDFETIKLKHARATHVAQVLDEAYNQNGRPNGFGGFGGGFRGGDPNPPRFERIRVVADQVTNTLLLRASPLDAMAIRNLVTRALDVPDSAELPHKREVKPKQ